MQIIVTVADKHLRGVPLWRYKRELTKLIRETCKPADVKIVRGSVTAVSVDAGMDAEEVAKLLSLACRITRPGEWPDWPAQG